MSRLRVPVDVGRGRPLVLLHGYAMRPATYGRLADLLAPRCRVVIPDLFAVRGRWRCDKIVEAFTATLDHLGLDRVSLLGHSFGGGIELGFAARFPNRVVELVFSDTLAVSRQFRLANEAMRHPGRLLELATPAAASAFVVNWVRHPRQLVGAAWWGFSSGRSTDSAAVAGAEIPAHVLWANRDSLLQRSDGEAFAKELGASVTVAWAPDGRAMDHDWMFQQPDVFVTELEGLGLTVLADSVRRTPATARSDARSGSRRRSR